MKLTSLIKKNIVTLMRAKTSALIIVLGPLIVILLAGLAFDNTNTYAVNIGTYSEKYNQLSVSFIDRLSENDFDVTKFGSQEGCIQSISTGEIHTCVVFSKDFTLSKNLSNEIEFYVDYSRINLVWTVLEVMTETVSGRAQELSLNLTKTLLDTLEFTDKQIDAGRESIISFTTINQETGELVGGIDDELRSLDLSSLIDDTTFSNLTEKRIRIAHWVRAMNTIAENALRQASDGVGAASGSTTDQGAQDTLSEASGRISDLRQELTNASVTSEKEFAAFKKAADDIEVQILQTQNQISTAALARDNAAEKSSQAIQKLDEALLQILFVQKVLNDVQNEISSIEVTDPGNIVQPIKTTVKPVVAEQTYLNYIFPIIIVLVVMFTALLLSPTLIMLEKNAPVAFRNSLTPVNHLTFIAATFITSFSLLLLQLFVILIIASIFFTSQVFATLGTTLLILVLLVTLFTLLGMIIGYLFRTEETATLASITIGSIFLFLSDAIIPIESMPPALRMFSTYNPFVYGGFLLRRSMIFGDHIGQMGAGILVLLLYVAIIAVIVILSERLSHEKTIKQMRKWFERKP